MSTTISVLDAAILGVVEGLTEFLPVSSTGHLKIVEGLLGIQVDAPAVVGFSAVIQVGAILAVIIYFLTDIVRIVKAWGSGLAHKEKRSAFDYKFAWWVIFATIPIVIVGLAAKSLIEGPLASLWVVASSLIVGSGLIWLAERVATQRRGEYQIGFWDAMIMGCSQILALLFPGFSRSGATIVSGLFLGLERYAATRLSFFLSIPALTGAGIYELKDALGTGVGALPLLVGTVVSFVVAYLTVGWLLRFVSKHSFNGFAVYRVLVGLAVFGLLIGNVIEP